MEVIMTDLILKREDLKNEYEILQTAMDSIRDLSNNANKVSGIDPVIAMKAINLITMQSLRCTRCLDDVFYPDEDE